MKPVKFFVGILLAAPLLAACADRWDTKGVEMMSSSGDKFQQTLHREYTKLAMMEKGEGDWEDAAYFVERAKMSAMGESVTPEEISMRDLPSDTVDELTAARGQLVSALASDAAKRKPFSAAFAQAGFDCWMQEQEENIQPKDIKACKEMFQSGISALALAEPMAEMPKKAESMPKPQRRATLFTVYFDFDSTAINAEAMKMIGTAAKEYGMQGSKTITVSGHADQAGDIGYNQILSNARAMAVTKALAKAGVPSAMISARSFGEKKPAVSSGENDRKALNRRVEIQLNN